MDINNTNLDENASFAAIKEMMNEMFAQQEEYFKLIADIGETSAYVEALGKHMLTLPMSDQIKYLRLSVKLGELSKNLCEKHHIDIEEEDTGMECDINH